MIQKALLNLSLFLNLILLTGCATTSPSEVECALREKFYTGYQKSQDAKANNINYEDNPKIRKASEQVHYCRSPKTQVEKEKINELKFKAKINKPIEKIAGSSVLLLLPALLLLFLLQYGFFGRRVSL